MPIENNPEIEESSEEEIEIEYKKKPVIKKPVVRKPKINKDIDEMKNSIKKLENLAISKQSKPKLNDERRSQAERTPPSKNIPKKKERRIRQIIYSESEDEEDQSQAERVEREEEIKYVKVKSKPVEKSVEKPITPKPPPMKPRRRFKFKN